MVVAEGPPNILYRLLTFRYKGTIYLADRSATIRYISGSDEIT